jgi:deoxyribose-phosphate aldolase
MGRGAPAVSRERLSVLADWGKDDEVEGHNRWGSTCADHAFRTHGRAAPLGRERQVLSVRAVAARLEHRLYTTEPTREGVENGCELAIRHGLSSVIVPPEMVPMVGLHLAGTSVGLTTLLGWRNGEVEPLAATALRAEAGRLVAEGATDVGVLATVERLGADHGRRFANEVISLVDVVQACGARVRVVLDTEGLTPAATTAACELLGATGAWLVQGGSWRGGRTGLSRIQLMRAALPDEVRLKWALPVRTLDSMMIGIAEGVDLYNGDPQSLLDDAAHRVSARPLLVPVRGVDY